MKESTDYKTDDGRDYTITWTYAERRSVRPCHAGMILQRQLLQIEVFGNISDIEAANILADIRKIHEDIYLPFTT